MPQERIVMRTYSIGGGFGRRLNGDYAVPAALAAKALGKPVKMVLTRPDDMRFDSFRSPSIQTLRIAFNADGKVTAMDHQASAGWPTGVMAPEALEKGLYGMPYDAKPRSWDAPKSRRNGIGADMTNLLRSPC